VLLRALSSSVTCSLLTLSPAKAVIQVDLAARRKESVPFDQVAVMILTGWPVTGRDAQVVPVAAQGRDTVVRHGGPLMSPEISTPSATRTRDLRSDLAGETAARRSLVWPGASRHWLPAWLPNLVSAANVRRLGRLTVAALPGRPSPDAVVQGNTPTA
jgi:hypothetical protein